MKTLFKAILVVEDEDLILDILTLEFTDAGYSVLGARDGETALAVLAGSAQVDLLFTDIRLPGGLDGWRVAEEARRLRTGLPVIYATGFSAESPRLVEGARFFKKPYVPSAVIAAIQDMGVRVD